MKKTSWALLIVLVLVATGIMGYRYVMNGGARDLSQEKPEFTVTSKAISEEFIANTTQANIKYLEKAVAISGTVTQTEGTVIILDHDIVCVMKSPDPSIKINQKITLKGRLVGYDDLLGEIKLDQCNPIHYNP